LYEIFIGKIFVLKNFLRVDILRKYFNTKICIVDYNYNYGNYFLPYMVIPLCELSNCSVLVIAMKHSIWIV